MKQIKMIDNYRQLPVGAYLKILEICEDDTRESLDRQAAIIAVLTGLTEDEVYLLPLDVYGDCAARTSFLEADVPESVVSVGKTITIGGVKYTVPRNPAKITTAQFVDFKNYSAMDKKRPVPELLSAMLVPEGCRYGEGYEVTEVQQNIRENLDTVSAFALSGFFLKSWVRFTRDSLCSLEPVLRKLERKGKKTEAETIRRQTTEVLTILEQSGRGLITLWPSHPLPILRGTPFGIWDVSNS